MNSNTDTSKLKITIAGASGFIGNALIRYLPARFMVRALSRNCVDSNSNGLEWRRTDLFSLGSTERALEGTDVAVYLVHSMMPNTRLHQASFADTDLLLADNFARACKRAAVRRIIYVGGLVPERGISKHLESRLEVESVLESSGIPVTVLRAGMVVGHGGSSFEILLNLVRNLPMMVLPRWADSPTRVIYIDDLVRVIGASLEDERFSGRTLDVVNEERLTYRELITQTIEHLGKKRIYFGVPLNSTGFSKLWVTVFGESKYELVSPLIDSLLCHLDPGMPDKLIAEFVHFKSYRGMLQEMNSGRSREDFSRKSAKRVSRPRQNWNESRARSIQRLNNISQAATSDIADEYMKWLPAYFGSLVRVSKEAENVIFSVPFLRGPLLILKHVPSSDSDNRVKFLVIGGLLVHSKDSGWLEFRKVADGRFTLAALHEFSPSLPWFLYLSTQARVHKIVMNKFSEHLARTKPQT